MKMNIYPNNMNVNDREVQQVKSNKSSVVVILVVILGLLALGVGTYFVLDDILDFNNKEKVIDTKSEDEPKKEEEKVTITPILYEVSKDGVSNKMYLFGSIHVADERAYPLPDEVLSAYNSSDSLAVEIDVVAFSKNLSLQMEALKILLLYDGTTVKDHLNLDTYNLLINYLKENKMYNKAYESYKPAMMYTLVTSIQAELSKLDANKGIDMYFLEKAYKDKKEILEIESAKSQYEMLGRLPDKLFDYFIKYSIENEEEMISGTIDLYVGWLSGNQELILENDDEVPVAEMEGYEDIENLLEQYNLEMIDKRNELMVNKAKEYFDSGKNTFYVVGLAHIIGEGGLAQVLEQQGYNVKLIEYK